MKNKIAVLFLLILFLSTSAQARELLYCCGDWDFEDGFVEYDCPICTDDRKIWVGVNWNWWSEAGPVWHGHLNENKWEPNCYNGTHSQEITFTYATGDAGIYRTITVPPGNLIEVNVRGKFTFAEAPNVELRVGIDPQGGNNHNSNDIIWTPWASSVSDEWYTQVITQKAINNQMTIFLAASHSDSTGPGATVMYDTIDVWDMGTNTNTPTPMLTQVNTPTNTPTVNCFNADPNCDGSTTPGDALFAFQIYLNIYQITGQETCDVLCNADTDGNGTVTPGDALCLFQIYLGLSCQ